MGRLHRREAPELPRRDGWVAALAAAGLAVAGYLAVTKWSGGSALFCIAGSGCDVVQASRYAIFLGLPTALWGALLYALIGGLALRGLSPRRWLAAFLLAVAGVSFSAYLTYLELFVLRAICGYCLVSAGVAVVLLGVLLLRRPPATGRRSPVRPTRVAALGSATAMATVILGAAVFATPVPQQAAAYQEALARHLRASGAVMYGAYW
ncbi:MAG: vitamin K epoxide reductase family protein [Candidatus Rokubacteria bacterium]|nr:vitamin K epoxide reductase family protein [Candidatus Rokubacteria bacterium]